MLGTVPVAAPESSGEIDLAETYAPKTFNPLLSLKDNERDIASLIYIPLAARDENLELTPGDRPGEQLLIDWSFDDRKQSLKMEVNPRARWHSGLPVTAADIAFTLELIGRLEFSPYFDLVEGIEVVTPLNNNMLLAEVQSPGLDWNKAESLLGLTLLPDDSQFAAMTLQAMEEIGREPIGNGPFKLAKFEDNSLVRLEAARSPGEGGPRITALNFHVIPEASSQLMQATSGDIDFVMLRSRDVETARSSLNLRVKGYPSRYIVFVGYNHRLEWLSEITDALGRAIDVDAIIDGPMAGNGRRIASPVLPSDPCFIDEMLPFDPVRAGILLDESGWKLSSDGYRSRDGRRLKLKLLTDSSQGTKDIALVIQQRWKAVGVDCELEHQEWNLVSTRFAAGEFEALLYGLKMPLITDPAPYLHGSPDIGAFNYGAYQNAEMDANLDALAASDSAARCFAIEEIQMLCLELQPNTYLYDRDRFIAVSTRLRNVKVDVRGRFARVLEWKLAD